MAWEVIAIQADEEKLSRMRAVVEACEAAGVSCPADALAYVNSGGGEVSVTEFEVVEEGTMTLITIDVASIPEGSTKIRLRGKGDDGQPLE